jgi:hypothetical protein
MKKTLSLWVATAAFALGLLMFVTPPTARSQNSPASATVVSAADITGDGNVHALAAGSARWVQIVCASTNGAVVRVGDSAISATRGIPIAAGAGFMLPPIPPAPTMRAQDQYYQMGTIYYRAANGDKISVVWGR